MYVVTQMDWMTWFPRILLKNVTAILMGHTFIRRWGNVWIYEWEWFINLQACHIGTYIYGTYARSWKKFLSKELPSLATRSWKKAVFVVRGKSIFIWIWNEAGRKLSK